MNSRMQGFERDTWTAVVNSKRVWLAHIIVNALLMIAFFYWTRIPEETGWQFTLTVVCGLGIGFVTLWLHSATFDYFSVSSENRFRVSLRRTLSRIPAFLVWTMIFALVLWFIGQLWDYDTQIGGWLHHLLPSFLRHQVTPRTMFTLSHWMIWFLYFILWPILFLPVGAQVAMKNFRGFFTSAAFRPVREVRFWLAYVVCFLIGAYVPFALAWDVPRKPSPLNDQIWSMVLRLGFGYLLLVTAWVILCAAIMRASDGGQKMAKAPNPAPLATPSPAS